MFGSDVAVPKFPRIVKGVFQNLLDARRYGNFDRFVVSRSMFIVWRIGFYVALYIFALQLVLLEYLLYDLAVGERIQQMFGIDFAAPEFQGCVGRLLNDFFGMF